MQVVFIIFVLTFMVAVLLMLCLFLALELCLAHGVLPFERLVRVLREIGQGGAPRYDGQQGGAGSQGEAAQGEAAQSEAAQGEAAQSEAARGGTSEGEAPLNEAPQGDTAQGNNREDTQEDTQELVQETAQQGDTHGESRGDTQRELQKDTPQPRLAQPEAPLATTPQPNASQLGPRRRTSIHYPHSDLKSIGRINFYGRPSSPGFWNGPGMAKADADRKASLEANIARTAAARETAITEFAATENVSRDIAVKEIDAREVAA
ncbi:MAG: hypothetical protein Q9183_004425, partial [Haloplaca sp. 2 TL-2023]